MRERSGTSLDTFGGGAACEFVKATIATQRHHVQSGMPADRSACEWRCAYDRRRKCISIVKPCVARDSDVREGANDDQASGRRHRDRRSAGIHAAAGLRGRRRGNPALLFPRAAVDRRQLPHVPGRAERLAEAGRVLRLGRARLPPGPERRAAGRQHQHADGEEGARRRDGIPADQSSARLPDLRSGRRMRSAGSGDGLRRRHQPLRREQARGRGQIYRRAGQDLDEPLHPLHALRPLHDRGRGRVRSSAPSGAARTWRSRPISNRR